jgi:uncharacterized cupredoxin-like copper-binding protein
MHKQSIVLLIVVLSVVVVSLAACGGSQAASEPTEVHITLKEFTVEMDKTSIPAGSVKFIIDNAGALEHEVVLEKAGDNDKPFEANGKESEAEEIQPSTKGTTLEWTIDQPGQYQLACHIVKDNADHYALGMVQAFTVTEK